MNTRDVEITTTVEKPLRNARRARAQKLKDEFLSIAAHEMRTPITVIKAQAQLAERFHAQGRLQGEVLERTLRTFVHESDRLARLCSDLLDVARIDSGSFEIAVERFDLNRLVREVVSKLNDVTISSDGHQIQFTSGEPLWVACERQRTERVLYSLLTNAIRYSPHGGAINVVLEVQPDQARVSIRDNGLGIPADKLSKIFDRYYQAHQTGLKGPSGLGLGLYLSREIVRRMGGEITAASDGPGRGALFAFTLPLSGEVESSLGKHHE